MDDEEIDNFSNKSEEVEKCKDIYISSNALLSENQIEEFEELKINVHYIPEYYFEREIMDDEEW